MCFAGRTLQVPRNLVPGSYRRVPLWTLNAYLSTELLGKWKEHSILLGSGQRCRARGDSALSILSGMITAGDKRLSIAAQLVIVAPEVTLSSNRMTRLP